MRESTLLQGIPASVRAYLAWYAMPAVRTAKARDLLWSHLVTRTMAGTPNAVKSVDAFLSELVSTTTDAAGIQPGQIQHRKLSAVLPGEMAMARDFVEMALQFADLPYDCEDRRDARAWLCDRSPIYSARVCFEAIGVDIGVEVDFDRVRAMLTKRWIEQKASESAKEGHA